jgi:hypothetical protein
MSLQIRAYRLTSMPFPAGSAGFLLPFLLPSGI